MYTRTHIILSTLFISLSPIYLQMQYNTLMADNINQHQYADKKVKAQKAAQDKIVKDGKLIEDTWSHVKKKEGKGKKGKDYIAYWDKVWNKKEQKHYYYRTVGHGINLDAPHNEKYMKTLVSPEQYQAIYDGEMPVSEALDEQMVRYNIKLGLDFAQRTIDNFDSMPYDVQALSTDMYYNMGNVPKKMPNFFKALNQKDYHQASLELKYHDPSKDKEKTTGYYDQTGGRSKEHFNTLTKYPRIEKVKERNELIFHFED